MPVLGAVLVAMSQGDWSYSEDWVLIGLVVWLAAALLAELVLWPAERRLRETVARAARVGVTSRPTAAARPARRSPSACC